MLAQYQSSSSVEQNYTDYSGRPLRMRDASRQGQGDPLTLPQRSSRSGLVITIQDSPVNAQGSSLATIPDLQVMSPRSGNHPGQPSEEQSSVRRASEEQSSVSSVFVPHNAINFVRHGPVK